MNIQKSKRKANADGTESNARYSDVLPGDQVLVQQEGQVKLSTQFNTIPYVVVIKHGNSLVVVQTEDHVNSTATTPCTLSSFANLVKRENCTRDSS